MADEKKSKPAGSSPEMNASAEDNTFFGSWKKPKIPSELIIIFFIGFLFGIAIKTEFSKRINIADKTFYGKQSYDFVEMVKRQIEQNKAETGENN